MHHVLFRRFLVRATKPVPFPVGYGQLINGSLIVIESKVFVGGVCEAHIYIYKILSSSARLHRTNCVQPFGRVNRDDIPPLE